MSVAVMDRMGICSPTRPGEAAPSFATVRTPERPSYGAAVAEIARLMGRPMLPWVRSAVEVSLEVQSEAAGDPEPGAWAFDDVTWTTQRQSGKTTGLRSVVAHRLGMVEQARVFMTAQKRDKARARWLDLTGELLASPLADRLHRTVGVSHECLTWRPTGGQLRPFAPNEEDMHGESPHLVPIDEYWAFPVLQARAIIAAVVPGFAVVPGQLMKTSTAGHPDERSWWYNADRAAGRVAVSEGRRLGRCYFEYSLPDVVDGVPVDDLTDEQLMDACYRWHPNPLLRPAAVRQGWDAMKDPETGRPDRAEFLRAYGNRPAASEAQGWLFVGEAEALAALSVDRIPASAPVCLGVAVDDDGEQAAVVAAWRSSAGQMRCEVVRAEAGTRWVAGFAAGVAERQSPGLVAVPVVSSPGRELADALKAAGLPVLPVGVADWSAACVRHRSDMAAGRWVHGSSPDLIDGFRHVVQQISGRSWRWGRGGGPVAVVEAATAAGWAFDHAPEPEKTHDFWMG